MALRSSLLALASGLARIPITGTLAGDRQGESGGGAQADLGHGRPAVVDGVHGLGHGDRICRTRTISPNW
jgi:hypothetical protein